MATSKAKRGKIIDMSAPTTPVIDEVIDLGDAGTVHVFLPSSEAEIQDTFLRYYNALRASRRLLDHMAGQVVETDPVVQYLLGHNPGMTTEQALLEANSYYAMETAVTRDEAMQLLLLSGEDTILYVDPIDPPKRRALPGLPKLPDNKRNLEHAVERFAGQVRVIFESNPDLLTKIRQAGQKLNLPEEVEDTDEDGF